MNRTIKIDSSNKSSLRIPKGFEKIFHEHQFQLLVVDVEKNFQATFLTMHFRYTFHLSDHCKQRDEIHF